MDKGSPVSIAIITIIAAVATTTIAAVVITPAPAKRVGPILGEPLSNIRVGPVLGEALTDSLLRRLGQISLEIVIGKGVSTSTAEMFQGRIVTLDCFGHLP